MADRKLIDTSKIKRTTRPEDNGNKLAPVDEARGVSAGPVEKVIELAFNPTREKIREVTIIDRMQGRLFPQLDMVNMMRHYCLEIATYRMDPTVYEKTFNRPKPIPPDPLDELLFRTAQWQKSVMGKNLERATDIALAETEIRAGEDNEYSGAADAWKE